MIGFVSKNLSNRELSNSSSQVPTNVWYSTLADNLASTKYEEMLLYVGSQWKTQRKEQ